MKTMQATEVFHVVRAKAEEIRNSETATVGTMSPGDVVRQGDLYVVCLREKPAGALKVSKERQLAPGTTQGSRHVLKGRCQIWEAEQQCVIDAILQVLPKAELFPALIGPVFRTIGQVELEHPEHGNRILPAGEICAVVYQRAFAEEVRRQED